VRRDKREKGDEKRICSYVGSEFDGRQELQFFRSVRESEPK
jgi:hypothetical protein